MAKSARGTSGFAPSVAGRATPALPPRWILAGILLLTLIGLAVFFWNPGSRAAGERPDENGAIDPRELLTNVAERYRTMSSYAEHVEIRANLPVDGQLIETVTHVDFAIQLPNQIMIDVKRSVQGVQRGVKIACDGEQTLVTVTDSETDNFDRQYVQRPAPEKWDAIGALSASEFTDVTRPNELLSLLMDFPVDLQISPMGLLLSGNQWQQMLKDARAVASLPDASIKTEKCHRVRVETPAGDFVFWIAASDLLIRRIEYPVGPLLTPDAPIELRTRASLVSHHGRTAVDQALPSAQFAGTPPEDGKKMRHFVLPYRETAPAALGLKPDPFTLHDCDGQPVSSTSWQDKVAVLLWFNDHPASQAVAIQLDRVRNQSPDDAPLEFVAVCTEPATEKSHREVADIFRRWQLGMPLVRDLQAVGRDLFDIEHVPTLLVMDRSGTVQLVEVGANPQLDQQLPAVLQKILAGENIAGEFKRYLDEQRRAHELLMASASWDAPATEIEIVEAVIAPRSAPTKLQMEPAWEQHEVDQGGNILLVPSPTDQWHLVANTGWDELTVLDLEGRIVKQVELKADRDVVISHLRTATDAKGRRYYAGSAALGAAVYVFDERFQHVMTYPSPDQNHPGIYDMWLSDMDENGELELYVGFAGVVGLHCVDMSGQRQWGNRSFSPVLSLTEVRSGRERTLLVTGASGQIDRVDAAGRKQSPVMVGSRAIHHLFASRAMERRPTQLCGMTTLPNGQLLALGLTPSAQEAWSYPLPPGNFGSQVRFVASGQVFSDDQWDWILAGPDGSLHIIADDGDRHESFHYGKRLHGVAALRVDGRALLVVGTEEGVEAWWMSSGE